MTNVQRPKIDQRFVEIWEKEYIGNGKVTIKMDNLWITAGENGSSGDGNGGSIGGGGCGSGGGSNGGGGCGGGIRSVRGSLTPIVV